MHTFAVSLAPSRGRKLKARLEGQAGPWTANPRHARSQNDNYLMVKSHAGTDSVHIRSFDLPRSHPNTLTAHLSFQRAWPRHCWSRGPRPGKRHHKSGEQVEKNCPLFHFRPLRGCQKHLVFSCEGRHPRFIPLFIPLFHDSATRGCL